MRGRGGYAPCARHALLLLTRHGILCIGVAWRRRYYHEKLKVPTGPSQQRILNSIVQVSERMRERG